jgi:transposase
MPAPKKYDQETRDRAVRMYQDRRRDYPAESAVVSRRRVGELLDVSPSTNTGLGGEDRDRRRGAPGDDQ